MTITRQKLNQILKEEIHRELQEQKLLQEKMNIFTKVHNQIKVEGNEANTLIDSALDKLGEL